MCLIPSWVIPKNAGLDVSVGCVLTGNKEVTGLIVAPPGLFSYFFFDPSRVWQHSLVEMDHEIFSVVTLWFH